MGQNKVWRKLDASFQGSHSTNLIPLTINCDNTCEMLSTNEAYWLASGFLLAVGLLPKTYQNSGFPEGKQNFSINYIVCLNNLGTVIYACHLGNGGNPLEILVSRHQSRADLVSRPF